MKKLSLAAVVAVTVLSACTMKESNPFFETWDTPFATPPFSTIHADHFKPAILRGIEEAEKAVDAIVAQKAAPTFENTIDALDKSGECLSRVSSVFAHYKSALVNDTIDAISRELSPITTAHYDAIYLNEALFARVKAVYEGRESAGLTTEQKMVVEKYYKTFVRGGANLDPEAKEALKTMNARLSELSLKFESNVLKETNNYALWITDVKDLAGLPESVRLAAAEAAKAAGKEGSYLFTLHNPSVMPFLQFADNRDLRHEIWEAYATRANHDDEFDNKAIISEIVSLRTKKAHLLGYESHAAFILDNNMAKTTEAAQALSEQVWKAGVKKAKKERAMLLAEAKKDGISKLEPWDWRYYEEKVRANKYGLSDSETRPYFQLDQVRERAFSTANRLYGITFTERHDIDLPYSEAKVFECKEADGSTIGLFYTDYFPRESKKSGAWMSSFRGQYRDIKPLITNTCNFTKPAGEIPSLLSLDENSTLFHEFGHALHGMLSKCNYHTTGGTAVPRDFVELPSQIMENWACDEDIIATATHYATGEVMPKALIRKIKAASTFGQGFATTEQLASALLDLAYHSRTTEEPIADVKAFEKEVLDELGLIPEIIARHRSTYFQHIFSGGYSAGYYAYTWAEVLDADAFEAFKESGDLFNSELATSFRKNILSKGGSEDAMTMYRNFRGRDPEVTPLLKRRGLQ